MAHFRKTPGIVYFTIVPLIIFYLVFLWGPMISAFWLSLHNWNPMYPSKPWVGAQNYVKALNSKTFRICLRNTFYYGFCRVLVGTCLALVVSLMMRTVKRSMPVFRTIYFIPVVTSMVACSVVWKFMYQPAFGLFNMVLRSLGLPPQAWLNSVSMAMPSVIAMSVWKGLGFSIVLLLSGLQGIPDTYYEAAMLDGAYGYKMLWHITLPMLRPTLVYVIVTGFIGAFQAFTEIYMMTQGGPIHATRVLGLHIYEESMKYLKMGYGSAMSFILFAIIFVFTLVQLKVTKQDWEY